MTVRLGIEAGSHSATAYEDRIPTAAEPFDSGGISEGAFAVTFDTPGTYDYSVFDIESAHDCLPHRSTGTVGRIVVGEPGGPAESSPIIDGAVPESEGIGEQGATPIGEAGGDHGGGMMGSGRGMRNGGRHGWMMLVPFGFVTVARGLIGSRLPGVPERSESREGHEAPSRNWPSPENLVRRASRRELRPSSTKSGGGPTFEG